VWKTLWKKLKTPHFRCFAGVKFSSYLFNILLKSEKNPHKQIFGARKKLYIRHYPSAFLPDMA